MERYQHTSTGRACRAQTSRTCTQACAADFKGNLSLSGIMSKASGDVKKDVRADLNDTSFQI